MDITQMTKSSGTEIRVGDMGSRPENESISDVMIKGSGTAEGLIEYAHARYKGMVILSESVREEGGKLIYTGRIKSTNGIPFSHRSEGKGGVILVDSKKGDEYVYAFGDVVIVPEVKGNPFAFGDVC